MKRKKKFVAEKCRILFNFLRKKWVILLVLSFLFRIIALFFSGGYIYPDEIFQTVEQAHRLTYGYGIRPFEFYEIENLDLLPEGRPWGVRSYFIIYVLSFLNILNPFTYSVFWLRFLTAIYSILIPIVVYKIGEQVYNKKIGFFAGLIASFWWELLYFSSRTINTVYATPVLLLSIYMALKKEPTNRDLILSGFFLGISFMIRFTTLVLLVPFFLFLRKRIKPVIFGLIFLILFQGFLDLFTWGSFLHSFVNFIVYNAFSSSPKIYGTTLPHFYFFEIIRNWSVLSLFLFPAIVYSYFGKNDKEKFLADSVLIPLILFSIVGHKEYRFILFLIPGLILFFSKGINDLVKKISMKKNIFALLLPILIISIFLSGNYLWAPNMDLCQATELVGKQQDLEQLIIFRVWADSCGYSYLHKNVPMYYFVNNTFAGTETGIGLEQGLVPGKGYMNVLREKLTESDYVICEYDDAFCLKETESEFQNFKIIGDIIVLKKMS